MENTYVVYDQSGEALIIDPGCYEKEERNTLEKFIVDHNLTVKKLVNTHCHIDHVLGNAWVKRQFDVELYAHKIEAPYLKAVETYAPNYGFGAYEPSTIDHFIDEGDTVDFGNSSFDLLFVPGHSAGHLALINHEMKWCISGDVLFQQSIGRTDLPGGDFETLIQSIHQKLFPLGDDYTVFPGHGPATTIGQEKATNPFCAIQSR